MRQGDQGQYTTRTGWLRLAVIAMLALAPMAALRAQDVPYTGAVSDDKSDVLAGAGKTFYPVGSVSKDTRVMVNEVIFGWLQVTPPEGVYSYISRAFVDASGDGKVGVVNSEKEGRVFAAALTGPGDSYRLQIRLNKGDKVQIVAEEGDYYKIVPPKGAYVFLSPGSVRPVRGEVKPLEVKPSEVKAHEAKPMEVKPAEVKPAEAKPVEPVKPVEVKPTLSSSASSDAPKPVAVAPVKPAEPPKPVAVAPTAPPAPPAAPTTAPVMSATPTTKSSETLRIAEVPKTQPVDEPKISVAKPKPAKPAAPAKRPEPAPAPVPVAVKPIAPPPPPKPQVATAESDTVKALEARLVEAQKLPLEKQPLTALLADYEAAYRSPELPTVDRRIVGVRLGQLRHSASVADALKSLQTTKTEVGPTNMEVPKPTPPAAPGVYDPSKYDAVGQLLASSVYNGDSAPLLYRLVEPSTLRTLSYVQPASTFNAQQVLGKIVGITGQSRYDPALKLRVFDVKKIDLLQGPGTPGASGDSPAAKSSSPDAAKPTPSGSASPAPTAEPAKATPTTPAPEEPKPTAAPAEESKPADEPVK